MAAQGSYPLNGRVPVPTDTATGVVTGATADIPLGDIAALAFALPAPPNEVLAGPATGTDPAPSSFRALVVDDLPAEVIAGDRPFTGQLLGPNGSAATPTYSYSGSPGDGLYSSGTGVNALATGGVQTYGFAPNAMTIVGANPSILLGSSFVTLRGDAANHLNVTASAGTSFSGTVSGSDPVNPTDFATKEYVDALPDGTVTSVALTAPSQFAVAGSPITGAGTLAVTWNTQAAHAVLVGPTTGTAAPTFRALAAADLPAGTGTVTSVGLALPNIFSVTGSPVTTSGTLTGALATQTAHAVLVGPTTGTAAPTFRALTTADLPAGTVLSVTGNIVDNTDPQNPVVTGLDQTTGDTRYVLKAGDTMTGPLSLPATGTSAATTLNFGTAGTGVNGTATALVLSTAGVGRVQITGAVTLNATELLQWGSSGFSTPDVIFSRTGANALSVAATAGTTFNGPAISSLASTASNVSYGMGGVATTGLYGGASVFAVSVASTNTFRFVSGAVTPGTAQGTTLGTSALPFGITFSGGFRTVEGSNAKQGIATLVAGTVTVANTSVTANSRILLTCQTLSGVAAFAAVGISARTPGTSFTIQSASLLDTSTVAYEIFEPA